MRFPLLFRSLVSLSASAQYLSNLIVNLFDSTSVAIPISQQAFIPLWVSTCVGSREHDAGRFRTTLCIKRSDELCVTLAS